MAHDPNSNRMFTKDLGASNKDCKCQSQWLVLWEDGEIIEKTLVTDHPAHLRDLQAQLDTGFYSELEDGTFKYGRIGNSYLDDEDNEPFDLGIVTINDKRYYKEPCGWVSEMFWISEDDLKEKLNGRANGFYVVVMEFACYSTYSYEGGEEYESDWVIVVLNDDPILPEDVKSVDISKYEIK